MTLNLSNQHLEDESNVFALITNPEKYKYIDLSNNNFTSLPQELSMFSNLIKLDISKNKFQDISQIIRSLQTFPSLQMLNIDIFTREDAYFILKSLPNLTKLNGQTTTDDDYEEESGEIPQENEEYEDDEEKNTREEIQSQSHQNQIDTGRASIMTLEEDEMSFVKEVDVFNNIIEQIDALYQSTSERNGNKFKIDFQKKVKEQIEIINRNIDIPDYLYKMNIARSKIEIYSFLLSEIISLLINNSKQIAHHKTGIEITINIIKAKINKNEHLLYEIISQLHYQLIDGQNISNALSLNGKEKQVNNNNNNFNDGPSNNKQEYTKQMVSNLNSFQAHPLHTNNTNNNYQFIHTSPSVKNTQQNVNNIPPMPSKKTLLLTLDDIFKYHTDINKSNFANRIPEQSLIISMIGYLQQKYGIKSLIDTWINHINAGITMYSQEESEINLFGKILNNSIEENAYYVYKDLKNICADILLSYIKDKNQYKSKDYIEKVYASKKNGFISYDEWCQILNIIFNNEKDIIHKNITQFIKTKNTKEERYQDINVININENRLTREERRKKNCNVPKASLSLNILYQDFIKLLLEFQIKLREKYLGGFVDGFKKVDKDKDGMITEDEFKEMMFGFKVEFEDYDDIIEKMLDNLDPFEGNKISFSSCVKILSEEIVTNDKQKMSILDVIVSQHSNNHIENENNINSKRNFELTRK